MGKGQAAISDGETGAYCTLGLAYCKVINMDVLQVAFLGGSNIINGGSWHYDEF